jgi:hypothetical protein
MKMKFFSVVSALFLITSCSKSDSDNKSTNATLTAGYYKITSMTSSKALDLNSDGKASVNLLDELECLKVAEINVYEDKTLTEKSPIPEYNNSVQGGYSCYIEPDGEFTNLERLKWSTQGNKLIIQIPEDSDFGKNNLIEGNTIIFNDYHEIKVPLSDLFGDVEVLPLKAVFTKQ